MNLALVFPGQGSQQVGMGIPLAAVFSEAREVFEEVDDALGRNLSRILFEGPEDVLRATENTQPALMAMSVSVVRVLVGQGGLDVGEKAGFLAGHSLGEYAALVAAGGLSLRDAACPREPLLASLPPLLASGRMVSYTVPECSRSVGCLRSHCQPCRMSQSQKALDSQFRPRS